ncbi:Stp1/IreP family PP2C-type Ser/Thr phosphatase [Calidifontibacillus erzurumensis]|uniref:protein-serine/threonine phosphatase n=1 Tax=Calidifontibacillus erzurumensis TaxID=2741433 RepID=A0A8J8GCD4_9BACI|nr:Stp1/IreP family PP2C-type Ser/Thr phosphatase [Calidifontibacillus erzurumensis]NSL51229.1 Stp1/IreP family PP2C-type Ser/Thr phosphatase [Calidifontibacillus erzurumensis]
MKSVFLTDRGKVRQHNEDSGGIFFLEDELALAVVADGMGGHQAGDVASQMAISEIERLWSMQRKEELSTPDQIEQWLREAVAQVNSSIYQYAKENEDCQGMGTTIVVVVLNQEFITVGHIGDSRCYLLNSNGFTQITDDHSLVNELVRSGQISPEDAEHHPRKNVLMRALGTEETVVLDIKSLEWEASDVLLLCSDGLTNKVPISEIEAVLKDESDLKAKARTLIDKANAAGGDDNISVALVMHDWTENGSE